MKKAEPTTKIEARRELTGLVAELAGILKDRKLDEPAEDYAAYLTAKYSGVPGLS